MKTGKRCITVYLVEDYKLTRIGIKAVLSEFKNIKLIGEAENAYDGLKNIFNLKPDVVLMDLGLPGMNGIDATKKIKEILSNTKIIILSSHNRESEVIAALGSGATGYCLKDISSKDLAEVIKTIHSGACWIDSAVSNAVLKHFPKPDDTKSLEKFEMIDSKYMLTKKELEVLKYIIKGKSNTEISREMFVSVYTIKAHVANILKKMSVKDRVQAAVKAVTEKLV